MNHPDEDFVDQVTALMPRMLRALLEREYHDLAAGVLTFAQYNVLLCLYDGEPNSMHAISGQLKLTPSNLTGIMNRLVCMAMVDRFNSDDDRRVVMARITQQGKSVIDRIMSEKRQTIRHIYHCLSPQDRTYYVRIMTRILQALETLPATGSEPEAES